MIDARTGRIAENFDALLASQYEEGQAQRLGFEARVHERWSHPLDLLYTLLMLAREAGEAWLQSHLPTDQQPMSLDDAVVLRLHMRACRTASEIMALLRSGYADGALGRWRTLHELVVVSRVIRKLGSVLARRYLDHHTIQQYRALQEYQRRAPALGFERIDADSARAVKQRYLALQSQYGRAAFAVLADGSFGWAAGVLAAQKSLSGLERLEAEVGLDQFRPYYRVANDSIHATTAGIAIWLGDPLHRLPSLSSASNAGLGDPGQLTAIYVSFATEALLYPSATVPADHPGWQPDEAALEDWQDRWIDLMADLTASARDSFVEVDGAIRQEEESRARS
jgi:hypothetical protein